MEFHQALTVLQLLEAVVAEAKEIVLLEVVDLEAEVTVLPEQILEGLELQIQVVVAEVLEQTVEAAVRVLSLFVTLALNAVQAVQ